MKTDSYTKDILNSSIKVDLYPLPDFKRMRRNSGLTLRTVEKETGISNAYLSQIENGKIKDPSYRVVMTLNAFYSDKQNNSFNKNWQRIVSDIDNELQNFDQEQRIKAGNALQDLANIFINS